jgi:hypothetical protein
VETPFPNDMKLADYLTRCSGEGDVAATSAACPAIESQKIVDRVPHAGRESVRSIAGRSGLAKSSLLRHRAHIDPSLERARENRDRLRDHALLNVSEGSDEPQVGSEELDMVLQTIGGQVSNFSLCSAGVVLDLRTLDSPLATHAAVVAADSMHEWARPDCEARRADGSTYRKKSPVGTARTGVNEIDDNGIKARYWQDRGYLFKDGCWVEDRLA